MVNSTNAETGDLRHIMCDMGCFYLSEFGRTLCQPIVGSAVHGGIHMLQIQPVKLASRLLLFPALNGTFKVQGSSARAVIIHSRLARQTSCSFSFVYLGWAAC